MCVCSLVFCFLPCLARAPRWEPAHRPHSEPQRTRLDQKQQPQPSSLAPQVPSRPWSPDLTARPLGCFQSAPVCSQHASHCPRNNLQTHTCPPQTDETTARGSKPRFKVGVRAGDEAWGPAQGECISNGTEKTPSDKQNWNLLIFFFLFWNLLFKAELWPLVLSSH